jgi:CBS domain-containing protein
MKTLKDLLGGRPLHFVRTGMNIIEVAKFMGLHNIGAVPVLEQSDILKLKGIFSERSSQKMYRQGSRFIQDAS